MNISKAVLDGTFNPAYFRYAFHHGKTGQQKVAEGATDTSLQEQNKLTGAAQGTLGQFEGPVQKSPFYKALLTSGLEKTSGAYDAARANMRQRANMAGFGYNQPVTQGAESELGAKEAGALAEVPAEATLAAAGPALSAAKTTAGLSDVYGGEALGWNNQAYNAQRGRAGLWNQLFGTGVGAGVGLGEAALMG